MMRAWIFGGTGFIGRNVAAHLARAGIECRPLGSRDCDLLDPDSCARVLADARPDDGVVFASARFRDVREAWIDNARMAEHLALALVRRPVGRLVYFSSADVYGGTDGIITEATACAPSTYYGIGKLAAELLLRRILAGTGIALTVFRLPGVYGPDDGGNSVVGGMCARALCGESLVVHGGGDALRDYVCIRDVCRFVHSAFECGISGVYNIATGTSEPVRHIAECVAAAFPGAMVRNEPVPDALANRPKHMRFDTASLRSAFPGIDLTPLETGIAGIIRERQAPTGKEHQ